MSRIYNPSQVNRSTSSSSSSTSASSQINKATITNDKSTTTPTPVSVTKEGDAANVSPTSNQMSKTNHHNLNSNSTNTKTQTYLNNLNKYNNSNTASVNTNVNSNTITNTLTSPTRTTTNITHYSYKDEKKTVENLTKQAVSSETTTKMSEELTRLINRLEGVTSRLENYEKTTQNRVVNGTNLTNGTHSSTSISGAAHPLVAVAQTADLPQSISGFDDILNGIFVSFKELSGNIGPDVKTIVEFVDKVLKLERSFLIEAARSVQPSQDVLNKIFQQFAKSIEEVQNFREKNRKSQLFNHLSAISESIGALGWIAISPAPAPYIKEMSDSAQFYTNRVLKDYKDKDANHSTWVKQWLQILNELQAYVKQNHTTGVSWNSAKQSKIFDPVRITPEIDGEHHAPSTSAAPGGPAVPPPPPPPPMPSFNDLFMDDSKSNGNADNSTIKHEALFAEINKGSDITRNLKKVSDDQKTHKNPNLRANNVVPGEPSKPSFSTINSKSSNSSNKPPVLELQDKKWRVEYQSNKNNLVIDETDLKHTIYIYKCNECTITVKGKVNSITLDSCTRVGLLFDDVLSTVEFINSTNVQMQVMGKVPTVSIEKTDGCQVYLSRHSLNVEIVTSKSSAMNILVPNENDDEFTEHPVPEQFKTIINHKTRKLNTTPSESV